MCESHKPCPICTGPPPDVPRYPHAVCFTCVGLATSLDGRPLGFSNLGVSGGFMAYHRDDDTTYRSHECLIRGVRCWADEAKFGGIVVQPLAST